MHEHLLQYGYVLVFAGTIFEMDATILAAAFLAHQGYLNPFAVIIVAASGTTVANQVYYALARKHGSGLVAKPDNRMVERVRAGVARHGVLLVLLSRFMFGFRIAIPAACGVAGMSRSRFLRANVIGALLWATAFGSAGYFGSSLFEIVAGDLRRHEFFIAAGLAFCVAAFVFWRNRGLDLVETRIAFEHPERLPAHVVGAMNVAADQSTIVSTLLKDK